MVWWQFKYSREFHLKFSENETLKLKQHKLAKNRGLNLRALSQVHAEIVQGPSLPLAFYVAKFL